VRTNRGMAWAGVKTEVLIDTERNGNVRYLIEENEPWSAILKRRGSERGL